jgi:hypothetical protein
VCFRGHYGFFLLFTFYFSLLTLHIFSVVSMAINNFKADQ